MIQRYAPEWPVDQMAVVDRNVLRIAIYEFHHQQGDADQGRHQRSGRAGQAVRLR